MSGRIRSLKPDWLDDELALKSLEARVLSVALVLLSDDHGLGRAHPDHLLSRVFPGRPPEVLAKALEDLAAIQFMVLYEAGGQKYFAVRNWKKHQRVDHPAAPKYPLPDSENAKVFDNLQEFANGSEFLARAIEALANPREPLRALRAPDPLPSLLTKPSSDLPDRSGSRAKGPKGRRRPVETPLPDPFELTDKHLTHTASKGWPEWWVRNRHENFCDLAAAKAWVYADWDRALYTHLRGEIGYGRGPEDLAHLAPRGAQRGTTAGLFDPKSGTQRVARPVSPPARPRDPNPPPALPPAEPPPARLLRASSADQAPPETTDV